VHNEALLSTLNYLLRTRKIITYIYIYIYIYIYSLIRQSHDSVFFVQFNLLLFKVLNFSIMFEFIQSIIDWFKGLFWNEEMEITLVGLQNSGKSTFVSVISVSVDGCSYCL